MPSSVAKIAAADILEKYCDLDGLTLEECRALNLDAETSKFLVNTLGPGHQGLITSEKKQDLVQKGFSKKFIEDVAGDDGNRALHKRTRWFSDRIVTHWYRPDYEPAVRAQMIQKLGGMGTHAMLAVSNLIEVLQDDDEEGYVRQAAAEALGRITEPREEILAALQKILDNKADTALHPVILATIGKLGADQDTLTILKKALRHDPQVSWQVRHAAAKALGAWGEAAFGAGKELAEALSDESWWVKRYAAGALGNIGTKNLAYSKKLVSLLEVWPEDEARLITQVLAGMGEAIAQDPLLSEAEKQEKIRSHLIDPLAALAASSKESGKILACTTLGQMGARAVSAFPNLLKALEDGSKEVINEALRTIVQIGKEDPSTTIIDALVAEIRADSLSFRSQGCQVALMLIGRTDNKSAAVVSAMMTAAKASPDLVFPAVLVFKIMGPKAIGSIPLLEEFLHDGKLPEKIRFEVVVALDYIGREGEQRVQVIPPLILALEDPGLRQRAQDALKRLGPVVIPMVGKAMGDTNKAEIQKALLDILVGFKPEDFAGKQDTLAVLVSTLEKEDESLRGEIGRLLVKIGSHAETTLVKTCNESANVKLVVICLELLGRMEPLKTTTIEAIAGFLGNSDPDINETTERVLARLGEAALPVLAKALENPQKKRAAWAYLKTAGINAVYFFREKIRQELNKPHPEMSIVSLFMQALAATGETALSVLKRDLNDGKLKAVAAQVLGLMEAVQALPELVQSLQKTTPEYRKIVTESLGKIGAPDAKTLHTLFEAFTAPDSTHEMRMAVLQIIGLCIEKKLFIPEIVAFLEPLTLENPEEEKLAKALMAKGGQTP